MPEEMELFKIKDRVVNDGTQQIYRFENGYGASVVRHSFSYGSAEGLFELAVLIFSSADRWDITYATPITDDVLGYLTEEDVVKTLTQVKELTPSGPK